MAKKTGIMSNRISQHISYAEATKSATALKHGIDNTPNETQLENMSYVAENLFEKARAHFGKPIAVTSFFRNRAVNKLVGGSANSEHTTGRALDLDADVFGGLTNAELFHFIKDNCEFDQLIWEYGTDKEPDWVHVSSKFTGNRNQILRKLKNGGYITL